METCAFGQARCRLLIFGANDVGARRVRKRMCPQVGVFRRLVRSTGAGKGACRNSAWTPVFSYADCLRRLLGALTQFICPHTHTQSVTPTRAF